MALWLRSGVRVNELGDAAGADEGRSVEWLPRALALPDGQKPFPWQRELLRRFLRGDAVESLDIPTGLGKTAVMAIWLVARACGAVLPRRLVYVVDRRAVVDQATEVAEDLRSWVAREVEVADALQLTKRALPISTLRGQHVDNREWLEDPSAPAIIVGTVDMIGSRLLFSGYGVSPKMRPYHAGLLGADSLIVLDEAHLVPPFEDLLREIANGGDLFGPRNRELAALVPKLSLLSLSATGRQIGRGAALTLSPADIEDPVVRERLNAPKTLSTRILDAESKLPSMLAVEAWELTSKGTEPVRCIVFCNSRRDASRVVDELRGLARKSGAPPPKVELFVGARRVRERKAAQDALQALGFLAGSNVAPERAVFLVATAAGEVGVDLDADHMVCDLVAWERMVQRLGRVNRRGKGRARVIVIFGDEPTPSKAAEGALRLSRDRWKDDDANAVAEYERELAHARALRALLAAIGEGGDMSPGALLALKQRPELHDSFCAATTVDPIRPALTRALVEAWSMTSLEEHSGRPDVDPWLRGWRPNDPPQTSIVWRTHLPVHRHTRFNRKEVKRFLEAAPPHASEVLETDAYRAIDWLIARAHEVSTAEKAGPSARPLREVAIALTARGDVRAAWTLEQLCVGKGADGAKARQRFQEQVNGAVLVVDARLGGLSEGLLDDKVDLPAETADDGTTRWLSREGSDVPVTAFRVTRFEAGDGTGSDRLSHGQPEGGWVRRLFFIADDVDGVPTSALIVDGWAGDSTTEDDRAEASRLQTLDEHEAWAERCARAIAERAELPGEAATLLALAARLHDEGKKAERWQRAFKAPSDGHVYAKTRGPIDFALLDGYRHELGSLPYVVDHPRFRALSAEAQDLALHLIATHHGFGRPVISTSGCDDAPPSLVEASAREVALRFARLQKRWGPWGLAWWEALLRAADQQASRENVEKA